MLPERRSLGTTAVFRRHVDHQTLDIGARDALHSRIPEQGLKVMFNPPLIGLKCGGFFVKSALGKIEAT
jgi:hypothetical protein